MTAAASLAEATRHVSRERILDAVDDRLGTRSWSSISMADIARAAGVSRQTVYNEFGSREALAQGYVLRETERFLVAVERAVLEHRDDPHAAVAAAFDLFLSSAAERPLIRAIVSRDGGDELLALVTTGGGPVLSMATGQLASVIRSGWPEAEPEAVALVADSVVRLAISHAALPGAAPHRTADDVARLLGPYLDSALPSARRDPHEAPPG